MRDCAGKCREESMGLGSSGKPGIMGILLFAKRGISNYKICVRVLTITGNF